MPVTQVMYYSRFQFPDGELDQIINAIMASAQKSNSGMGLTGCLAYGRGWFLQILEGEADAVTAMMARISADKRHTALKILLEREARGRSFPEWSMACIDLLHDMPGYLARGTTDGEMSPLTTPPLSLLMTLMNLADRNRMSA
jgi:hypothetical protein